ncbi:hypothetical protein MKX03_001450 [Papaver bracteatum]|nr:hypothetical protein MKX03_001450 [Papaver bracteatum]
MESTSNSARAKAISRFRSMGFEEKFVIRAVDTNAEGDDVGILEALLAYNTPDESPPRGEPFPSNTQAGDRSFPRGEAVVSDCCSSDIEWDGDLDEVSDFSNIGCLQNEETLEHMSDKDQKMMQLVEMGFPIEEVTSAIHSCDSGTPILELIDHIHAYRILKEKSYNHQREHLASSNDDRSSRHRREGLKRKLQNEDEETLKPKAMRLKNKLPDSAIGPPYFYIEDVALASKRKSFEDIEPEFVDSKLFSPAARRRGFIHNLPTDNRFQLLPKPPLTIEASLPQTTRWWPSWDSRTQLGCLLTSAGSAELTPTCEGIRETLERSGGDLAAETKKFILFQCQKWNLVWIAKNSVAPLEPEETELFIEYPKFHTKVGGANRTDRYKALRNSFQVDALAYHLSVLKDRFPKGISVLSLYSGIGGAELALYRLGIPLTLVVAVEPSIIKRKIYKRWWVSSGQKGKLIDSITDVKELTIESLRTLINAYGGFDLVIGGSPCKNHPGTHKKIGNTLEGKLPVSSYDFCKILDDVKFLMATKQA